MQCRMGNQLFQYAFVKALSEKFNTSFYLNEKVERLILSDFFDLEGYHPVQNLMNKLLLKIQSGSIFKSLNSTEIDTFSESLEKRLRNHTIYNGYFQSEFFFKEIAKDIQQYIRVKKKHMTRFDAIYKNTFSTTRVIAVHLRRGDYLDLNDWWAANFGSNNLTLPVSYYLNCIAQVPDYKNHLIIFVSDDISFARKEFGHIANAIFSEGDMMTDFQILMNADVCILSNSSFAWWAGYLNAKKSKIIFCPRYWLGFKIKREYPDNIIPLDWIQVNAGDEPLLLS
jgi:hypothetical protein